MRTTLMIEDDIYETAKQIAQNSGRSLGEIISQLPSRRESEANRETRDSSNTADWDPKLWAVTRNQTDETTPFRHTHTAAEKPGSEI
jgi:hypothetical protein